MVTFCVWLYIIGFIITVGSLFTIAARFGTEYSLLVLGILCMVMAKFIYGD